MSRTTWPLALLGAGLLCSCAPKLVTFREDLHRQRYEITDAELAKLTFYVSSEVIAHGQAGASGVVILERDTPGRVVESGPQFLIVSFQQGGDGAPFALERSRSIYRLATPVAGRSGLHRIETLKDKVLVVGGQRFQVVQGADAFLLVDEKQIQKLIGTRTILKGRD